MNRRLVSLLGVVMLVLLGTYLAVFGASVIASPAAVAFLAGFALSATLMIVGGVVDSVTVRSRTASWNVLLGSANVLLAIVVTLSAVRSALLTSNDESWVFTAAMLVGGTSLAWLGVQTARDDRHIDLEATPSSRRLVAITLLVAVSFGIGLYLAIRV